MVVVGVASNSQSRSGGGGISVTRYVVSQPRIALAQVVLGEYFCKSTNRPNVQVRVRVQNDLVLSDFP